MAAISNLVGMLHLNVLQMKVLHPMVSKCVCVCVRAHVCRVKFQVIPPRGARGSQESFSGLLDNMTGCNFVPTESEWLGWWEKMVCCQKC